MCRKSCTVQEDKCRFERIDDNVRNHETTKPRVQNMRNGFKMADAGVKIIWLMPVISPECYWLKIA